MDAGKGASDRRNVGSFGMRDGAWVRGGFGDGLGHPSYRGSLGKRIWWSPLFLNAAQAPVLGRPGNAPSVYLLKGFVLPAPKISGSQTAFIVLSYLYGPAMKC